MPDPHRSILPWNRGKPSPTAFSRYLHAAIMYHTDIVIYDNGHLNKLLQLLCSRDTGLLGDGLGVMACQDGSKWA